MKTTTLAASLLLLLLLLLAAPALADSEWAFDAPMPVAGRFEMTSGYTSIDDKQLSWTFGAGLIGRFNL